MTRFTGSPFPLCRIRGCAQPLSSNITHVSWLRGDFMISIPYGYLINSYRLGVVIRFLELTYVWLKNGMLIEVAALLVS